MRRGGLTIRCALGWVAALAAVGLAGCGSAPAHRATSASTGAPPAPHAAGVAYAYVTFSGWYDNSPPGCQTMFSGCAGGVGTYRVPITFASDPKEFKPGTRIYVPALQKYFVMGDECVACMHDWRAKGPDGGPGLHHVDLWVGGANSNEFEVINCEDGLTAGTPSGAPVLTPVLVAPPPGLPVSTQPLYSTKTGCFGGVTSGGDLGQYRNAASGLCIEDPGDSVLPGTAARVAPCNGSSAQALFFEGAFFTVNSLCLDSRAGSRAAGTPVIFSECQGGPSQQWEINTNGTVAGIQSHMCVAQSGRSLVLAACTAKASQRWAYTKSARL